MRASTFRRIPLIRGDEVPEAPHGHFVFVQGEGTDGCLRRAGDSAEREVSAGHGGTFAAVSALALGPGHALARGTRALHPVTDVAGVTRASECSDLVGAVSVRVARMSCLAAFVDVRALRRRARVVTGVALFDRASVAAVACCGVLVIAFFSGLEFPVAARLDADGRCTRAYETGFDSAVRAAAVVRMNIRIVATLELRLRTNHEPIAAFRRAGTGLGVVATPVLFDAAAGAATVVGQGVRVVAAFVALQHPIAASRRSARFRSCAARSGSGAARFRSGAGHSGSGAARSGSATSNHADASGAACARCSHGWADTCALHAAVPVQTRRILGARAKAALIDAHRALGARRLHLARCLRVADASRATCRVEATTAVRAVQVGFATRAAAREEADRPLAEAIGRRLASDRAIRHVRVTDWFVDVEQRVAARADQQKAEPLVPKS